MKAITFWGCSVWLAMLLVTASAAQPSDSPFPGPGAGQQRHPAAGAARSCG